MFNMYLPHPWLKQVSYLVSPSYLNGDGCLLIHVSPPQSSLIVGNTQIEDWSDDNLFGGNSNETAAIQYQGGK